MTLPRNYRSWLILACLFVSILSPESIFAQYGPVEIKAKLNDFRVTFTSSEDAATFVIPSFIPAGVVPANLFDDEFAMWLYGKGNLDPTYSPTQGDFYYDILNPPTISTSTTFDSVFFDTIYNPPVPTLLDISLHAWEDDIPSDFDLFPSSIFIIVATITNDCEIGDPGVFTNTFTPDPYCCVDASSIFGASCWEEGDDEECNDPLFAQLDYTLGPPCQWFTQGSAGYLPASATCPSSFYEPSVDTYWRYTLGEGCANAIPLGSIGPGTGTILTHFNSNQCYSDNFPPGSGGTDGNDVTYEITLTGSMGLSITTCGLGTNFDNKVYLLDAACTIVDSSSDGCGGAGGYANMALSVCPPSSPSTYYVVVEGQTASDLGEFTLTVSEDPTLTLSANAGSDPAAVCDGDSAFIGLPDTLAASGGEGAIEYFTFNWSGPPTISDPDSSDTWVLPGGVGTYTYTLTVTDSVGCTATDQVDVRVKPNPQPNLGPDTVICPSTSILLDAGLGYDLYAWFPPPTPPTPGDTSAVPVYGPGSYVVFVDSNGCQGSDVIAITAEDGLELELGNDTAICDETILTLDASDPTHPGTTAYLWHDGSTGTTFPADTAGTYHVTVSDAGFCESTDTIVISIDTLPVPNIGTNFTICEGSETLLDGGTAFADHIWNTGVNSQYLIITTGGTYSVTVTDLNECQGIDTIEVDTWPLPVFELGNDTDICEGKVIPLDADSCNTTPPCTYSWSTGESTQSIIAVYPGNVSVVKTDGNGCQFGDTINISLDSIDLNLSAPALPPCDLAGVTLDAGAFDQWVWFYNDSLLITGVQTIDVNAPGVYGVTVTEDGCTETAEVTIIPDCPQELFIPNVFSPNADGMNDEFKFVAENIQDFNLVVFNRWGVKVFETTDINVSWNGTYYNGGSKEVPEGIYFWAVEYVFEGSEKTFKENGPVTLVR